MVKLYQGVKRGITEHLRHRPRSFEEYFPPNNYDIYWLIDPFVGLFQMEDFSIIECEQSTVIANDSVLKQNFLTICVPSFWTILTEEYPEIWKCAVRKLLLFPTTCLGECGFS